MCALMINLYKIVHTFHTKISYSAKNYVHMVISSHIRIINMVIYQKRL